MRALTVLPGMANSLRIEEVPEPPPSEGSILARAIALGVCGTDREIVAGQRLRSRRFDRRFCAASRSGAMSSLCGRRMGYVS